MSNSHPLPPKKEVALALLERSSARGIFVHLDPRQAAVVVPPWFKKQPQLVLQIGLNMPVPIPDLRLDEEGVSCTLSFNRSPFYCVVPWGSVFAMVGEDGRGMVWPDDVPAEVPLARQTQDRPSEAPPAPPPTMRALDGARKDPKPATAPRSDAARGDEEARKAKRPRKRPPLAAVPNSDAAADTPRKPKTVRAERTPSPGGGGRGIVAVGTSAGGATKGGAKRSSPKPAPAAGRSKGSGKKRELPPYLRVVK